ncbi:MAG: preprotein translocase subunit SecG [Candidatus Binatia bacterium]|nr:preprotein translocase subunit SecG [Candidatus Binatia bacterium]MDG2009191.1 preprotein translocase subunit SecG [Candidatus Binatia bacterium]
MAITIVHILSCFFLIGVVLLQTGKGADAGAAFGGGSSQTVFGSSGAGNLLTRLTTGTAILFMVTSLGLTWLSTRSLTVSVTDSAPVEAPPLAQPIDPLPLEVAPAEPADQVAPGSAPAAVAKPIAEAGSPAAQRAEDAPLEAEAAN